MSQLHEQQEGQVLRLIEKQPPSNVDAEMAVLGGILLDPNAIERVFEILRPEMFYLKGHQEIYRVMIALHLEQLPTDLMTISDRLSNLGLMDVIGGRAKLMNLIDCTVGAVNVDEHAKLIAAHAKRRELYAAGQEICRNAYDLTTALPEACDRSEAKLMEVTCGNHKGGLVLTSESLPAVFEDIEVRSLGQKLPGVTCGFYDLDAMTQGFQRSDLIIVAGRPSMGKTSFVINIARNIAEFHNLPIAFFSLEMDREQLLHRLLSAESRIESGRLKAGRLDQKDWDSLGNSIATLSGVPIAIDDTSAISVAEIRSKTRKLMSQFGMVGAVVVDYLQLMGTGEASNRVQELSAITRSLKNFAKEIKAPVIVLSQLSRGVESRTNKRPMMSDLRESGGIEQDADLILMLYRDEYYNPETPDRGIAEVILSKHRNGPTGTVKLLFENQFTQFRNLARGSYA